jgi:hypothetical protein
MLAAGEQIRKPSRGGLRRPSADVRASSRAQQPRPSRGESNTSTNRHPVGRDAGPRGPRRLLRQGGGAEGRRTEPRSADPELGGRGSAARGGGWSPAARSQGQRLAIPASADARERCVQNAPGPSAGRLATAGEDVPGYAYEDGVDVRRATETFVEIALDVDDERTLGSFTVAEANLPVDPGSPLTCCR